MWLVMGRYTFRTGLRNLYSNRRLTGPGRHGIQYRFSNSVDKQLRTQPDCLHKTSRYATPATAALPAYSSFTE